MKAKSLYQKLNKDFELNKCKDDWSEIETNDLIAKDFNKRYMGLFLDSASEIKGCFTAVFPSELILKKVLTSGKKDILLFLHHPMIWNLGFKGYPFKSIQRETLLKLKQNRISVYVLHVPLDKNGQYSTTVSLAKALEIKPKSYFCKYFGVKVGVIGKTNCKTVDEMAQKIETAVGHKLKIWSYGSSKIKNGIVALIAGGGNDPDAIKEIAGFGINLFITGVTKPNKNFQPSIDAHNVAKKNKINIIGATHYSTEKFACLAMNNYFKKIGLPGQFLDDRPDLKDLQ
ncbi:MAG: hypothetical protein A2Y98_01225 [Candidatus Portnoybacteria bacterium RBG_19FT_COMBO_36_7]|uniref:Nif3-like dinuclear metal center hexameric protein n=1 Tax=Candidatus Portnoybacteria bacterium RBG_19FT_COMBO_36_7 TaxID=1801992 RepID=A0A1G2F7F1_9BACT|nr:MAG: hypothetical protein A2Y98_01225 [Candidatus Portnoybacteria bacterium RBG_19FT_COMBO_36_7]